jgi:allophanate hydrolase
MPALPELSLDLATLGGHLRGGLSPVEVAGLVCERVSQYSDPAVWTHLVPRERLIEQARSLQERRAAGADLPLLGVPFAVKDNVDAEGLPTTAGLPAFAYVARRSAPAVRRLLDAGALLVGKTNLDQFATGLCGDRSPYGACRNVFDPDFISGGSSSGSAVAVAAGLVSFALGTDTAGSGRVPAGCNNVIGVKPTPGLWDADGVVPACRSLDCVSAFTLTAADAAVVSAVIQGARPWSPAGSPPAAFATPADADFEFLGDQAQAEIYRGAITRLEEAGARREVIDLGPFREVALLLYEGPWLAERLANLQEVLEKHSASLHPVTRSLLEGGRRYSAADLFRGTYRLDALRKVCLRVFERAEVLVVPTMPTIPTLAQVKADSLGWSRRLGHYTNFVNLLGLAAVAVPAGFTPSGLPGGVTFIGPAHSDARLLEIAADWQRRTALPLGATGAQLPPVTGTLSPPAPGRIRVSVAGAHLRGQPLHPALLSFGARFVREARTAPRYRFYGFLDLQPPRPGLLRVGEGASISVEIYDLPAEGFGKLVASVAPPLAIGTVELADGEAVKGFLCESFDAAKARDISEFGGWLAFLKAGAASPRRT